MDGGEFIFLMSVAVVLPLMIIYMALRYNERKLELKSRQSENSLTTSELDALIESVVERAVAPLDERLEILEAYLDAADLDLEDPFGEASEQEIRKTVGRTTSRGQV